MYDKSAEIIIQKNQYGESYDYVVKNYGNRIMGIKNDDTPKNQRRLDFSNLENGTYYVYYQKYVRELYEVEIVLTGVDD